LTRIHTNPSNIQIIYEDNHIIAINKRAGDLVQGDKSGDPPLAEILKQFIKKRDRKPGNVFMGVIHRIDRPVSGVVVFAKTSKALSRMNAQLKEKSFQKTYWAIVEKEPSHLSAKLVDYLKKNEKKNKSFSSKNESSGSKKAELSYKLIAKSDRFFLLSVLPITGRHHQIRVQLSINGTIIKGDLKYGAKRSNKDASISLHARELSFIHPTQKIEINLIAEVPKDELWNFFVNKVI
jgi:23S rRNA pseudouridine1911/1915/1917 synthase